MRKSSILLCGAIALILTFALGVSTDRRAETSFKIIRATPSPTVAAEIPDTHSRFININTATAAELTGLDGIGEVISQKIVEYRTAHGGFKSIEEIMNVKGIGEKKFAAIRDSITVD